MDLKLKDVIRYYICNYIWEIISYFEKHFHSPNFSAFFNSSLKYTEIFEIIVKIGFYGRFSHLHLKQSVYRKVSMYGI
jgi:hypothetical protein